MGASKTEQYTNQTLELAKIANALGHPARITIIKLLKEYPYFRNVDLQSILKLSQSAVHDHITKLNDAQLIKLEYSIHEYHICLLPENLDDFNCFVRE